ncbi:MAG: VIT domain-containing protein, partial [Planctomycetaceae bacterium]|nr:VIT domain-containing protein [Planctomycetaceae bacterium]
MLPPASRTVSYLLIFAAAAVVLPSANAQIAVIRNRDARPGFKVSNVEVNADIDDQVATVQIAQTFQNVTSRTLETQFVFPLPEDAAISALTLIVDGKELTGELKPRGEARKIYEDIVRRQKDPALLEFVDHGVFRTSVFPVPAGKSRRVEIRYRQLLKSDSGLVDFGLPMGSVRHCSLPVDRLKVAVRVNTQKELKNIYSPTHDFDIDRVTAKKASCKLELTSVSKPDDIRLLFGTRGSDVGMDLVTFKPEGDEQGYFMLLASPRVKTKKDAVIPKTVVFVVDRSGSMAGEKLEQAKASLNYMISSLGEKDTFNIVSYSSDVDAFKPELEVVTSETRKEALGYVEDLYSGGGTNIDEALKTSLSMLKDKKRPTYVLFFTDGLPTVGNTKETTIAAHAKQANAVQARVFSFGVGYDVNSRLLDRLSSDHRGTSVYVKPEQDVEVASTSLFRKVSSPAMTALKIQFASEKIETSGKLVNRVYPAELPDLFFGEQLVVVGRYRKPGDVSVTLTGDVAGKARSMKVNAQLGDSSNTSRNTFVEELWATRRIGQIIDELDLNGQNKELIDELVALSLKHGIMTPYTSDITYMDRHLSKGTRSEALAEAARLQGADDEAFKALELK